MYSKIIWFSLLALVSANQFLSNQFIEEINEKAETWTAGKNFHPETPLEDIKKLMGLRQDPYHTKVDIVKYDEKELQDLPENFDAREAWPQCSSIREIRDQGHCGSCWAEAVTETITDRVCIRFNGTDKFRASANHLMSCCHLCGAECNGGIPLIAWGYYVFSGIVSGGPYGSNASLGCQPYAMMPCEHHGSGNRTDCKNTKETPPKCENKCVDGYPVPFNQDKHKGDCFYLVWGREKIIMREIQKHGPVQAGFQVYADFINYKSGVYQHTTGDLLGGHAIKIIGWGTENGTPYWLVANSWNYDWGSSGFFKILRGSDHCGIESQVFAGIPKKHK